MGELFVTKNIAYNIDKITKKSIVGLLSGRNLSLYKVCCMNCGSRFPVSGFTLI